MTDITIFQIAKSDIITVLYIIQSSDTWAEKLSEHT